jgi:hypothetical protein
VSDDADGVDNEAEDEDEKDELSTTGTLVSTPSAFTTPFVWKNLKIQHTQQHKMEEGEYEMILWGPLADTENLPLVVAVVSEVVPSVFC